MQQQLIMNEELGIVLRVLPLGSDLIRALRATDGALLPILLRASPGGKARVRGADLFPQAN